MPEIKNTLVSQFSLTSGVDQNLINAPKTKKESDNSIKSSTAEFTPP